MLACGEEHGSPAEQVFGAYRTARADKLRAGISAVDTNELLDKCFELARTGATCMRADCKLFDEPAAFIAKGFLADALFRAEVIKGIDAKISAMGFTDRTVDWKVAKDHFPYACITIKWQTVTPPAPASNLPGPCPICMEEAEALVALTPCGHLVCTSCSLLFLIRSRCPCCRQRVTGCQNLFQA